MPATRPNLSRWYPRPAAPRRGKRVVAKATPGGPILPYSGPFNFVVQVLLAFDGPNAASPNWIDVTNYIDTRAMIRITHGRADGIADVNASTCSLTADNSDGRWCALNSSGAWYGLIRKGCWLRVVVTPPSGISTDRFVGFITTLPTVWTGQYASSQITASDRFEKLGFAKSLVSSIQSEVLSDPNLAGKNKGYWNLHEGSGALAFGDTSGNGTKPLVAAGLAGPAGLGFAASNANAPGFDGLRCPTFNPPSVSQGTYLSGSIAMPPATFSGSTYTGLWGTLQFWFQSTTTSVKQMLASIVDPVGQTGYALYLDSNGLLSFGAAGTAAANPATYFGGPISQARMDDGAWHHVMFAFAPTTSPTIYSFLYILDGTYTASGGSSGVPFNAANISGLIVGAGYDPNAPGAISLGASNLSDVTWYWADQQNPNFSVSLAPNIADHFAAGATGFTGESTDRRVARIARYAGVPIPTVTAAPTSGVIYGRVTTYNPVKGPWTNLSVGAHYCGTQNISGRKALDVAREAGRTEGMPLFVDRSGYLALQASTIRQNTTVAWTVDSRDLDPATSMPDDYAYTTNQMTITPNGQAAQLVIGPVGAASQLRHGERDGSQATANVNATEAQSLGLSIIQLRADPPPRLSPVVVEAATLAAQAGYGNAWYDAVLATEISTPFRVTNLPPQAGGGSLDALAEGWIETILSGQHLFAFNTSPIQGPTYQADDAVLGRADTDGSTLSAGIDVGATTFSVATTGAGTGSALWTTNPDDLPFDVGIDAEQITVTNISAWFSGADGTFETGAANWTTSNATISQSTIDHVSGTACGLLTASAAGFFFTGTPSMTASPNTPYRLTGWVKLSTGSPTAAVVIMNFYNSGGTQVGSATSSSVTPGGTWVQLSVATTSPATTASAKVFVQATAAALGDTIRIDNVMFQPTNGPQLFVGTRSVNGMQSTHNSGAAVALWSPLTLAY